jgi:hypothetical protein
MRLRRAFERATLVVLVVVLLATGSAKLLTVASPPTWLPGWLTGVIGVIELAAAVALCGRGRRHVAIAVTMAACVGTALMWLGLVPNNCGCLGAWALQRRSHLVLLSGIGLCAVSVVRASGRAPGADGLGSIRDEHAGVARGDGVREGKAEMACKGESARALCGNSGTGQGADERGRDEAV